MGTPSLVETSGRARLSALYQEGQALRDELGIIGSPGSDLFDNGLGWDGDLDHEMLVVADGLGGAMLMLMDQGCQSRTKEFSTEKEALSVADFLLRKAQGDVIGDGADGLDVDEVEWD